MVPRSSFHVASALMVRATMAVYAIEKSVTACNTKACGRLSKGHDVRIRDKMDHVPFIGLSGAPVEPCCRAGQDEKRDCGEYAGDIYKDAEIEEDAMCSRRGWRRGPFLACFDKIDFFWERLLVLHPHHEVPCGVEPNERGR